MTIVRQSLDPLAIPLTGSSLIEASAGTGKTYILTTLFVRLIISGLNVGDILVVTFTNAATAELRDRIRFRLNQVLADLERHDTSDPLVSLIGKTASNRAAFQLRQALSDFDNAAVFTIHSFCHHMLQDFSFESGMEFNQELIQDQLPLYREIATDFWVRHLYQEDPLFVRFFLDTIGNPDTLLPLVQLGARQSDLLVLPEKRPVIPIIRDEYTAAYRVARDLWWRERDTVRAILESDDINHGKLQRKSLDWFVRQADLYFEPEKPQRLFFPDNNNDKVGITLFTNESIARVMKSKRMPPRHPFFDACSTLVEADRQLYQHMGIRILASRFDLVGVARIELQRRKRERGVLFFDDLLHLLDKALSGSGGDVLAHRIRGRFKAALIDEFQDTDQTQYRIFKRIFSESESESQSTLFLIGDPKQSIYAFRGADVFAYLHAIRDRRESTFTLTTNYRSDRGLIAAVNTLYRDIPDPFLFKDVDYIPVKERPDAPDSLRRNGSPVTALTLLKKPVGTRVETVATAVAAHILSLLNDRIRIGDEHGDRFLSPSDITVLIRSRYEAGRLRRALGELRIPAVMSTDQSVFHTYDALELFRLLQGIESSGHLPALKTALCTSLLGLNGDELLRLQEDERELERWFMLLREWRLVWQQRGFIAMMSAIHSWSDDHERRLSTRLCLLPDGERRMTNHRHLVELLHEAARSHHLGMTGVLAWFGRQRASESTGSETHELRLERDDEAVKLVTIHKSKGLEYPIVYCPSLADLTRRPEQRRRGLPTMFHDPDRENQLVGDIQEPPSDLAIRYSSREELAENLRLQYVSLTRAKHACFVLKNVPESTGGLKGSTLDLLIHHPRRPESTLDESMEICSNIDPETCDRDLERLVAQSNGVIACEDLPLNPATTAWSTQRPETSLTSRCFQRDVSRQWRISSYSDLTQRTQTVAPDDEWRDLAPVHEISTPAPMDNVPIGKSESSNSEQVILAQFPRGVTPGRFLHEIFEELDFRAIEEPATVHLIRQKLDKYGLSQEFEKQVMAAIKNTLSTDLSEESGDPLRLQDIPLSDRLSELEFMIPVDTDSMLLPQEAKKRACLTGRDIGNIFRRFGNGALRDVYASRLDQLDFTPLRGFLKGFIDLVFRHNNRSYIVDYKSNFLGHTEDDYAPTAILEAMITHHYILQYHLYLVALHRLLQNRLPGYDYERHVGGIRYLFLRGITPRQGITRGVYCDRPSRAMIEGLSALFHAPQEDRQP